MRLTAPLSLLILLTLTAGFASRAHAQQETAVFNVSFAGFRGGTLSINSVEQDGKYQVVGVANSTGIVGGLYRLTAEARASGRVSGNRYTPAKYDEVTKERGKTKTKKMRFSGGVPTVTQNPPDKKRKKYHANGKDFPGVLDSMTGLYALLRSRPADLACNLDISTFDGREVHRIVLSEGKKDGKLLRCAARYIRVAGYRPKDLADTSFRDFEITYDTSRGALWPVVEVRAKTSYGTMVFKRR